MKRWMLVLLPGLVASLAEGQSVTGRVSILERPGEVTEDLQNVVVYLEPLGASVRPSAAAVPMNTVIALQSRKF